MGGNEEGSREAVRGILTLLNVSIIDRDVAVNIGVDRAKGMQDIIRGLR